MCFDKYIYGGKGYITKITLYFRVSGISVMGSSALWFAMYVVLKYDIGSMVFVIRGLQGIFDVSSSPHSSFYHITTLGSHVI